MTALVGRRFGALVVLTEAVPSGDGHGGRGMIVRCRCDCGTERDFRLSRLSETRTCGCGFARSRGKRAAQDVSSGIFCPECYDLPHRRPKQSPCKCGNTYQEEPKATALGCLEACGYISSIDGCRDA